MHQLTKEVLEIAANLTQTTARISNPDLLQIAVEIQRNRLIQEAFVLDRTAPTALEAIAIALGAR